MTTRKGTSSGNPPSIRQSKNAADLRTRRQKATDMRIAGCTYEEIVRDCGISIKTARDDIAAMLRIRDELLIPQLRALEEHRLDIALKAAMDVLEAHPGTELALKATDRIVRAVSMRARLLGLEAPVELNVRTFEKTQADLELDELLREAQARAELQRQTIVGEVVADDPATPVA